MEIVGSEQPDGVHTIEMWFSNRRRCWIVERRDRDGEAVGHAFRAADEQQAEECLADWLRAHGETHLVGRHHRDEVAMSGRRDAA